MVTSDDFAEFLREQLAPLGRVTMRRMFGKTGVFCDGLMLGMVADNTLYFRVDDHNRATFREAESFPPLNYKKQGHTVARFRLMISRLELAEDAPEKSPCRIARIFRRPNPIYPAQTRARRCAPTRRS
jgi:TfoX/Sxy family transcriptional regulator of competence genes